MPEWLRAKLLEQPEITTVEDLCIFARKQLSVHYLCKTDDSVMDAFREMGPSIADTLVTALTKLSTSQEAMDNRLNEMSKKSLRNEILLERTNSTIFRETKHNKARGALFRKTVDKTQILLKVIIAEILEAASAVMLEDSEDLDQIIRDLNGRIRTKIHIHHDNSHIKIFRSKIQILFFSRNLPASNL